jgi:hypothetical protein
VAGAARLGYMRGFYVARLALLAAESISNGPMNSFGSRLSAILHQCRHLPSRGSPTRLPFGFALGPQFNISCLVICHAFGAEAIIRLLSI